MTMSGIKKTKWRWRFCGCADAYRTGRDGKELAATVLKSSDRVVKDFISAWNLRRRPWDGEIFRQDFSTLTRAFSLDKLKSSNEAKAKDSKTVSLQYQDGITCNSHSQNS